MELWIIYAIIASVLSGISAFSQKIASQSGVDSLFLIIANSIIMVAFSLVFILFTGADFTLGGDTFLILILLSILSGAQLLNTRIRGEVLKYLSSSEYFISARILTTVLLTVFGIFIFHEFISHSQFLGLIIGTFGVILLFEEDTKLQNSRNWSRAIYLLFVSILLMAIIQITAKYASIQSNKIAVMLFYEGIFIGIFSYILYHKQLGRLKNQIIKSKEIAIALFFGITVYFSAFYNLLAFSVGGPVGIVVKILGYSLFIPIILSIIFFRERVSVKKVFAFALTIISIYYLN